MVSDIVWLSPEQRKIRNFVVSTKRTIRTATVRDVNGRLSRLVEFAHGLGPNSQALTPPNREIKKRRVQKRD